MWGSSPPLLLPTTTPYRSLSLAMRSTGWPTQPRPLRLCRHAPGLLLLMSMLLQARRMSPTSPTNLSLLCGRAATHSRATHSWACSHTLMGHTRGRAATHSWATHSWACSHTLMGHTLMGVQPHTHGPHAHGRAATLLGFTSLPFDAYGLPRPNEPQPP